jgi:ferredoxin
MTRPRLAARLAFVWISVVQTLLRMLPFPCRTGLVRIGDPDHDAPVFLTGNFRLTVERVKRALLGLDAFLLVANSRGVNVWCAATGGLLTNHDVISVLKTSGIRDLVRHRRVILPQLAATGVEGIDILRKTGFRIVWGPVEATDIPAFLDSGLKKPARMRTVRFPWTRRLEMAVAWAFPISLLGLLLWPFWPAGVLPLMGFVWGAALALFLAFPLYQHFLTRTGKSVGLVVFDFGQRGIPLLLWILFLIGLVGYGAWTDQLSWTWALRWGVLSFVVLLILCVDLTGGTPVQKSGLHEDRLFGIALDARLCQGVGSCQQVCPMDVFEVDTEQRCATLPGAARCVQCGACIVQCPLDALSFHSPGGDVVGPETIRKFKLNLLGQRK